MIKAILFDKDGTIISLDDTWMTPSLNVTEELLKTSTLTENQKVTIREELGLLGDRLAPDSLLATGSIKEQADYFATFVPRPHEEIVNYLKDTYYQYLLDHLNPTVLHEGVEEVLAELKENYIIAMVTNDDDKATRLTLERLGLIDCFDFIACADKFGAKPNPAALFEISKQFNIRFKEMVYVGDSEIDYEYGKLTRAFIAYQSCQDSSAYLEDVPYIITNFRDLPTVIQEINEKEV